MVKNPSSALRCIGLGIAILAMASALQGAFYLKAELPADLANTPLAVSRQSLEEGTTSPVATAVAQNGKARLTVDTGPGLFSVQIADEEASFVAADGQTLALTVGSDGKTPQITGGPDQKLYQEYEAFRTASLARLVLPVRAAISIARASGKTGEVTRLTDEEISSYLTHRRELNDFTLSHLRNSAALYAASLRWDGDYRLDELATAVHDYSQQFPQTEIARLMENRITRFRATAIGSLAPAIAGPTPDGASLQLADLRGRYVLLDFWASWCAPCRVENQHYVKLHQRYRAAGFEILAVSVDQNERAWKAGIATDKATWRHISDLSGWKTPLAGAYNVSALPASFLIDPEGRIIAKNLRGQELDAQLKALFPQAR